MQKLVKIMGVISIFLSVMLIAIFVQYLVTTSGPSDGWADLGFFLIMFILLALAIILSIPFLIIGFKLKFKNMRFYLISHLFYLVLSVVLFVFSLIG
jgi:hypothetical protein